MRRSGTVVVGVLATLALFVGTASAAVRIGVSKKDSAAGPAFCSVRWTIRALTPGTEVAYVMRHRPDRRGMWMPGVTKAGTIGPDGTLVVAYDVPRFTSDDEYLYLQFGVQVTEPYEVVYRETRGCR